MKPGRYAREVMASSAFLKQLEADALRAIRAAFPVGDPPLAAEMPNDHCEECIEVSGALAGKRWDEVTTADLRRVHDGLPLLTEAALRYYLPAVLRRCIGEPLALDIMPMSTVSALSPPNGRPDDKLAYVADHLDGPQVRALLAFLTLCDAREKAEQFGAESIDAEALECMPSSRPVGRAIAYWKRRLEQQG